MTINLARIQNFHACVHKTRSWAENNFSLLCREPDLQGHYKSLYFWAAVGNPAFAGRHLSLIKRNFLRSDGDFRTEEDVKGFRLFPCSPPNQYIYPNGWLITGLQKLGCYDLVQKGLEFILPFQDDKTGGFYFTYDPKTRNVDRRLLDSSSTSSAGLALLAAGQLQPARRAGDFLVRLLESQPQPQRYFFSCMQPDGTVFTDVFGRENAWDPDGRKQKCLSAESDGMRELTWLIGKPTKFLTKLYRTTGEKKYLDAALWGFDFFHRLDHGAWTNYASCKTMWSAAELFHLTGEERFAETTRRILDHYCDTQSPSGTWVHTLWYENEKTQPLAMTMDITFEYGAEISDVILDINSKPPLAFA
jgi:hypothetical protein